MFYTPLYLNPWGGLPAGSFPALRKWRAGATPAEFKRIAPATRIYRTDEALDPYQGVALHTVSVCDLAKAEMSCESTAVLGPPGRVFYVSRRLGVRLERPEAPPAVFRIPLGRLGAQRAQGERQPDRPVLLPRRRGRPPERAAARERPRRGMWGGGSRAPGDLALLRVPLASFSDGRDSAPAARLPQAARGWPATRCRTASSATTCSTARAPAGAGRRPTLQPKVGTRCDYAGDSTLRDRARARRRPHRGAGRERGGGRQQTAGTCTSPACASRATRSRASTATCAPNAAQGETRSHGFFYKPESEHDGLLGLPIVGGGESAARQLRKESASVLYLRNRVADA